jgi:biopolymer transport protein ExbD
MLYLNSKKIAPQTLEAALLKEFSVRPDWYVYVQGSPDLPWKDIAQAIDTIRAAHGTAILLPR